MMEPTEVKKLFTKFKKAAIKEGLPLNGCCYMTSRQMAHRTATVALVYYPDWSYEDLIKSEETHIENVKQHPKGYDVEAAIKNSMERIARFQALLEKFGTKEAQVRFEYDRILNSKAFKAFVDAVGEVHTATDRSKDAYFLRICY